MILIGIGANLPSRAGSPLETCRAAVAALEAPDLRIERRSRWFESTPVPASDQPNFVNGVIVVATALPPTALLARLHAVERTFGRRRRTTNEARPLDLDLLDYEGRVRAGPEPPILPHPRMHGRVFVLRPMADVAPDWRHPADGRPLAALIAALPQEGGAWPLAPDGGDGGESGG